MAGEKDNDPAKKGLNDSTVDAAKLQAIYGVGYAKPPTHSQFKKGKSGNERGRPRNVPPDLSLTDLPTLQAALDLFKKTVNVRDADGVREMSRITALLEALYVQAAKGNARAAGLLLDLLRIAEAANARQIKADIELWSRYKSVMSERLEEARTKGIPMEPLIPHPDDIEIDSERGPKFLGPLDDDAEKHMQESIKFRHALVLQAALDEKLWPKSERADIRNGPGSAFELAKLMNNSLPPRLRDEELWLMHNVDRYSRHSKRWLLKEVYSTWRRLGRHMKRGQLFPRLEWGIKLIITLRQMAKAIPTIGSQAAFQAQFQDAWREIYHARNAK